MINIENYKQQIKKQTEVEKIDYSTVDIVYSESDLPITWSNHLEVIHVLIGEGVFTIDGRDYNVRTDTFIIINPNQVYSATAIVGRPLHVERISFTYESLLSPNDHTSYEFILPLINKEKYLPNIILKTMPLHSAFTSIFYQLSDVGKEEKSNNQLLMKSYIFHLLYLLYDHRFVYKKQIYSNIKKSAVSLVKESINYIKAHYNEDIDLDFMCVTLETSKPHLCRVFKRHTNKTLTEYINDYRIYVASDYLVSTDKEIQEIAFDVGYNNLSYFNKRFKQKTMLTPNQYRDSHKKKR